MYLMNVSYLCAGVQISKFIILLLLGLRRKNVKNSTEVYNVLFTRKENSQATVV